MSFTIKKASIVDIEAFFLKIFFILKKDICNLEDLQKFL